LRGRLADEIERSNEMRKGEGAILLAHGSKNSEAQEELEEIAIQVRKELGEGRVILAFLQFNHPNLPEAIAGAAAEGLTRIVVVPFFLAPGVHVRKDIPAELDQARVEYPGVEILLARPLLPDPRMGRILLDRIREAPSG
jgi:sirohydrochlorin ferrochelatase